MRPTILVDGVTPSEVVIGATVALSLQSTTGITSVVWAFEKVPVGSTAAPASPTALSTSATFDLPGEYILTCRSQSGRRDRVTLRVYTAARELLITQPSDSASTLHEAVNRTTQVVDGLVATASTTQHVASVAALRSSTPETNGAAILAGRVTRGDGGGGVFIHDPSDTTTADDGALTVVTAGGARLRRVYTGPVDVRWFGAVGDASTLNDGAFAAAVAALDAAGGGVLLVPAGVYRFADSIDLGTAPKTVRGEGWATSVAAPRGHAQWTSSAISGSVLWFPTTGGVQVSTNDQVVRDLAVLGPGNAADTTGLELGLAKARNHVANVLVANFNYGLNTLSSESSSLTRITALGCTIGIRLVGTDMSIADVYCVANGAGIHVEAFSIRIYRCVMQGNVGYGLTVANGCEGVSIDGCWFELNGSGSILMDATTAGLKSVSVSNSRGSDVNAVDFAGEQIIGGLRLGPCALFQSSTITIPSNVQGAQIDRDSSFYEVTNSSQDCAIPYDSETVLHHTSTHSAWELAASILMPTNTSNDWIVDAHARDAATGTKIASWRDLRATYYRLTGAAVAVGSEVGQVSPDAASAGAESMLLWVVKAGGAGETLVIQVSGLPNEDVRWAITVRRRDIA